MRPFLYFSAFCFIGSLFLIPGAFAQPGLKVNNADYDFGEVFQGDKVTYTYTFSNNGDSPLLIDRVKSSCGCTAALLSSKTLAPGEEGTIKATFDSTRFRGSIKKTIFIYSNLAETSPTKLSLSGIVKLIVEFTPLNLDFGKVKEGEEKQLRLTLKNAGDKVLQIENIRANNTALSARTDAKHLPPGEDVEFTAFARPIGKTKHLNGYLLVRTDNKSLGEIRIPVRGLVDR